jgi:hypothetical protein
MEKYSSSPHLRKFKSKTGQLNGSRGPAVKTRIQINRRNLQILADNIQHEFPIALPEARVLSSAWKLDRIIENAMLYFSKYCSYIMHFTQPHKDAITPVMIIISFLEVLHYSSYDQGQSIRTYIKRKFQFE